MSLGAIASFIVGILKAQQLFPLAGVFVATSILSLAVLYFGTKKITTKIEIDTNSNEMPIAH